MIVGEVDFQGSIKLGHQVKMGYYAQNQTDFLDNDLTILQTIEEAVTEHTTSNVRTILGSFLFSNDDVSKKISVLSGGERARVALCKLLLEPYNLLVMDEPTNHLDITSKELLKKALLEYDGSLIVVSHDRHFLYSVCTHISDIDFGKINHYSGNYTFWYESSQLAARQRAQQNKKSEEK